jgi:hypothetical protein
MSDGFCNQTHKQMAEEGQSAPCKAQPRSSTTQGHSREGQEGHRVVPRCQGKRAVPLLGPGGLLWCRPS